ncbi:MAG: hypothetical protein ACTSYE_12355, partial [Alphaproteobacteria bacterium]
KLARGEFIEWFHAAYPDRPHSEEDRSAYHRLIADVSRRIHNEIAYNDPPMDKRRFFLDPDYFRVVKSRRDDDGNEMLPNFREFCMGTLRNPTGAVRKRAVTMARAWARRGEKNLAGIIVDESALKGTPLDWVRRWDNGTRQTAAAG